MRDYAIVIANDGRQPPRDAKSHGRLATLRTIVRDATFAIYAEDGCPVTATARPDWMIGDAFKRIGNVAHDLPNAPSGCFRARCEQFTRLHWGDYIGIFTDRASRETAIALSPFGQRPLIMARIADGLVLASSIAVLRSIANVDMSIDWGELANFIVYPEIRPKRTCLLGVDRVLPGSILVIGPDATVDAIDAWRPWDFLTPPPAPSSDIARDLEATIDNCVAAWSSTLRSPLLEVSGGLDSSILAASLFRCRGSFASATIVPATADGNELAFARAVSETFGLTLQTELVSSEAVDIERLPACLTPQPGPHLVAQHFDDRLMTLGERQDVDMFVNGAGGDNVFARMNSAAPVIERQRAGGSLRAVWQSVRDVAVLTGSTYPAVLRNAMRRRRRSDGRTWSPNLDFVSRAVTAVPPSHPWMESGAVNMPAKARQIRALVAAQSYVGGQRRPLLYPLLSQPIVECCLAIPSWSWIAGGEDRAVARNAFRARIPEAIRLRRSKGALDGLFAGIFRCRRATIRDLLLGGLLMENGLLDRAEIEAYMRPGHAIVDDGHYRVIELLGHELWARSIAVQRGETPLVG